MIVVSGAPHILSLILEGSLNGTTTYGRPLRFASAMLRLRAWYLLSAFQAEYRAIRMPIKDSNMVCSIRERKGQALYT